MHSLFKIAAKAVCKNLHDYNENTLISLPESILEEIKLHLSPWLLFCNRNIFKKRNIRTTDQWKSHVYRSFKYTCFRRNDCSKWLSYSNEREQADLQMLIFVENVFKDLLFLDRRNIHDCKEFLNKIIGFQSHDTENSTEEEPLLKYEACFNEDTWIPYVQNLSIHFSHLDVFTNTQLTDKLVKTVEGIAIFQVKSEESMMKTVDMIEKFMRHGKLRRVKVSVNKVAAVPSSSVRCLLLACTGHVTECDIHRKPEVAVEPEVNDSFTLFDSALVSVATEEKHSDAMKGEEERTFLDKPRCCSKHCPSSVEYLELCNISCKVLSQLLTFCLPLMQNLRELVLSDCLLENPTDLWHAIALKTSPHDVLTSASEPADRLVDIRLSDTITTAMRIENAQPHALNLAALLRFICHMGSPNHHLLSLSLEETFPQAVRWTGPEVEGETCQTLYCRDLRLCGLAMEERFVGNLAALLRGNDVMERFQLSGFPDSATRPILTPLLKAALSHVTLGELTLAATRLTAAEETLLVTLLPACINLRKLNLEKSLRTPSLVVQSEFIEGMLRKLPRLTSLHLGWNRLGKNACILLASLVDHQGNLTTALRSLCLAANIISVVDLLEVTTKLGELRQGKEAKVLNYLNLLHLLGARDNSVRECDVRQALTSLFTECDVTGFVYQEAVADYIAVM